MSYSIRNIGNAIAKELSGRSYLREACFVKFNEYASRTAAPPVTISRKNETSKLTNFKLKQDFVVDSETKMIIFSVLETISDTTLVMGIIPENIGTSFELADYTVSCYGVYANSAFVVNPNTNQEVFKNAVHQGYEAFYGQNGVNVRLLRAAAAVKNPVKGSIVSEDAYTRSYIIQPKEIHGEKTIYDVVVYYCGVYAPKQISLASTIRRQGDLLQKLPDLDSIFSSLQHNQMVSLIFTREGTVRKVSQKARASIASKPVKPVEKVDYVPSIMSVKNPEDYITETISMFEKGAEDHPSLKYQLLATNWSAGQKLLPNDIAAYCDLVKKSIQDVKVVPGVGDSSVQLSYNMFDMLKAEIANASTNKNSVETYVAGMMDTPVIARASMKIFDSAVAEAGVAYPYSITERIPDSHANFHVDPHAPPEKMSLFATNAPTRPKAESKPISYLKAVARK